MKIAVSSLTAKPSGSSTPTSAKWSSFNGAKTVKQAVVIANGKKVVRSPPHGNESNWTVRSFVKTLRLGPLFTLRISSATRRCSCRSNQQVGVEDKVVERAVVRDRRRRSGSIEGTVRLHLQRGHFESQASMAPEMCEKATISSWIVTRRILVWVDISLALFVDVKTVGIGVRYCDFWW